MAKKTNKKKVAAKSITEKKVENLIEKKFAEVNSRIDRILEAMAKSKPFKHL